MGRLADRLDRAGLHRLGWAQGGGLLIGGILTFFLGLITFFRPLAQPRVLPVREDIEIKTQPEVKIAAVAVLVAVAVFYIIFW